MDIEDLAQRQRLESAAKAKRLAQRRDEVAFWDGSAATLGDENALPTSVSSNGPLRSGQNVRLLQSTGINQADTFSRTDQSESLPIPTAIGNVKVCLRVKVSRGAGIAPNIQYWLGGDRKTPIKLFDMSEFSGATDVASAVFEATGSGKDDWILSLRLSGFPAVEDRLYSINGAGEIVDSGWAAKWRRAIVLGQSFWTVPPIISTFALYETRLPRELIGLPLGQVSYTRLRGSAGGFFSFIEWDIEMSYGTFPERQYYKQTFRSTLSNVIFSPTIPGLSLPYTLSYRKTNYNAEQWLQFPSLTNFNELGAANACAGQIVTASCVYGSKQYSGGTDNKTEIQAATYSAGFGVLPTENFGSLRFFYEEKYEAFSIDNEGINKTATNYCHPDFNQNVVYSTLGEPTPDNPPNVVTIPGRTNQAYDKESVYYVAPGVAKPFFNRQDLTLDRQENLLASNLEVSDTYQGLKVFKNGYVYRRDTTPEGLGIYDNVGARLRNVDNVNNSTPTNPGSFMSLAGGVEFRLSSFLPGTHSLSWIVSEEATDLTLYQWDYTYELFPNGNSFGTAPLSNLLTKDQSLKHIRKYSLADTIISRGEDVTGYVNAMKGIPGAATSTATVVGAYYWPKS